MTTNLIDTVREWARAERDNDADRLAGFLTEDFAAIGPRGFQLDREAWLQRFRDHSFQNQEFEWDELQTADYEHTAIVRGVLTTRGTYQGQPTGGHFRGTQVYMQDGDTWKLAALQLSEIMQPPAQAQSS